MKVTSSHGISANCDYPCSGVCLHSCGSAWSQAGQRAADASLSTDMLCCDIWHNDALAPRLGIRQCAMLCLVLSSVFHTHALHAPNTPPAALELVYWLRRLCYTGHIYFDTFPLNEDPVREVQYNVRHFQALWAAAGRLHAAGMERCMQEHDALCGLELLQHTGRTT